MAVLLLILVGYLCGSIPFGLVIAHVRRVDLRAVGSGNIGATNAARALGKGYGLLVLVLDALKATGPIWLASGGRIQVHSWEGKGKQRTCRVLEITKENHEQT